MMKYSTLPLAFILFASCISGQKLFEKTTADNGKAIVRKEIFSGLHYLYIKKVLNGSLQYTIFYNCECGVANKIGLSKEEFADIKRATVWTAVTDTTSDQPKFFDDTIEMNRLIMPIQFMGIRGEEKDLLEEGLRNVHKECCVNINKPVNAIIGFVRVKLNDAKG